MTDWGLPLLGRNRRGRLAHARTAAREPRWLLRAGERYSASRLLAGNAFPRRRSGRPPPGGAPLGRRGRRPPLRLPAGTMAPACAHLAGALSDRLRGEG